MESTNLHHQDQPPTPEPSSSSLSTTTATPSSFHGAALGGTNHSWTPNFILNAGGNPRSRVALTDNNDDIGVPLRPLIQDSGYHHHWPTSEDAPQSCLTTTNQYHLHLDQLQQQHLSSKIKEEINLPKFNSSEMLNMIPSSMEAYGLVTTTTTTTSRTATTRHMKNIIEHHNKDNDMNNNNNNAGDDLNEKLLLKTLFSGDLYSSTNNAAQNNYYPHHNFGSNSRGVPSRGGNFSQIYPSINISNLTHQPSSNSTVALVSSPAMESLDLLTSPSRSFISSTDPGLRRHHHSHQDLGRRFADNLSFRLDHMQHHTIERSFCTSSTSNSSNPSSHFANGTAEVVTKRPCTSSMELESSSKASQSQTATKKSRSESRPSCPPFKFRKEKLGDRIAALQQLVAPFGKTDTASVLMEAIGYIKFLQSQVETLSVPYMNQSNRSVMQRAGSSGCIGGGNGEEKIDLRSRGLCLMPLSCMSYIAAVMLPPTSGTRSRP